MSIVARWTALACVAPLALSVVSFAQRNNSAASAAVASAYPSYGRKAPVKVGGVARLSVSSGTVFNAKTGKVVGAPVMSNDAGVRPNVTTPPGGNIDGLNTLPTFDGAFAGQAGPSTGREFRFTMIGNQPVKGGVTRIPAKVDEVSLQLLKADGSVFQTVPFSTFETVTLNSPNFRETNYRTGPDLQYADAVQRAEFFNRMKRDWHTELTPQVVNKTTITVPYYVNIQLQNGNVVQARSYFTGTAADGNTFVLMLDLLFNFFFDNEVVDQIDAGNFTTDALNMTLFPNTFLFSLNANNPNTPGGCCVLGFHTYFLDGAVPQDRWVTQYASWISPGLFGAGFEDVTGLSHETSEAFNDPFVDNPTPNWQFPGVPANAKVCQNNLETGDPVEVLPTATVPIEIRENHKIFIYHPQTEALLQWFEMGTSSNAIDGAFSFPDETALPHSALPCPQ